MIFIPDLMQFLDTDASNEIAFVRIWLYAASGISLDAERVLRIHMLYEKRLREGIGVQQKLFKRSKTTIQGISNLSYLISRIQGKRQRNNTKHRHL